MQLGSGGLRVVGMNVLEDLVHLPKQLGLDPRVGIKAAFARS